MRAFAALTIYVSLAAVLPAEPPSAAQLAQAKAQLEQARRDWPRDAGHIAKLASAGAELANLYRSAGNYDYSERLLRGLMTDTSGDPKIDALVRNNLADLLREEGKDVEAAPLFQQSIDAAGLTDRERAAAWIGLADIDRQHGRWAIAIDRWNAALDIARATQDSRTEAIALRGLGMTWLESGSPARSEPLLRRALKAIENDPGVNPEMVAGVRSALGELYRAENKLSLAENEWTTALEIERNLVGEVHPQVAWLMEMLSDVFSARGEFALGSEYATRAAETMSASFGETSMPVACALANRALVEHRAGNPDASARDYQQALRISRSYPDHPELAAAIVHRYADLLKTMHRGREAKALLAPTAPVSPVEGPVRSFSLR